MRRQLAPRRRPRRRRPHIPVFGAALLVLAISCTRAESRVLVLATTTSVDDTGLFGALLPAFAGTRPGVHVRLIAVGSGQALALGRSRDADVLFVHAPAAESAFIAEGHGVRREPIMENDFVIVGPPGDPASVRGGTDVVAALRRLSLQRAAWLSRGDSSGTHRVEQMLFQRAGIDAAHGLRVLEAGQGMAETLVLASERAAYTLTDRSTYRTLRDGLALDDLVQGDPLLRNVYSVIIVNGARNTSDAIAFAAWLRSPDARRLIADFGRDRYGSSLFTPVTTEAASHGAVPR